MLRFAFVRRAALYLVFAFRAVCAVVSGVIVVLVRLAHWMLRSLGSVK